MKIKPESVKNKIILRNPRVIEYIEINCKALKCSPDELIIKLMNNMMFLSKLKKEIKND